MKTIPPAEFMATWDRRATVIDVREPDEYARGHVPGAALIPLGELTRRLPEVPKSDTVYVICASGNRSNQGAQTLSSFGVNAISVAEGTTGWTRRRGDLATGLTRG